MDRLAGKRSMKRYLDAFQGAWKLTDESNCDICYPIPIMEMNYYIGEDGADGTPPWFCEKHAREWNLLW